MRHAHQIYCYFRVNQTSERVLTHLPIRHSSYINRAFWIARYFCWRFNHQQKKIQQTYEILYTLFKSHDGIEMKEVLVKKWLAFHFIRFAIHHTQKNVWKNSKLFFMKSNIDVELRCDRNGENCISRNRMKMKGKYTHTSKWINKCTREKKK